LVKTDENFKTSSFSVRTMTVTKTRRVHQSIEITKKPPLENNTTTLSTLHLILANLHKLKHSAQSRFGISIIHHLCYVNLTLPYQVQVRNNKKKEYATNFFNFNRRILI
jgi:hypothetical protein